MDRKNFAITAAIGAIMSALGISIPQPERVAPPGGEFDSRKATAKKRNKWRKWGRL